MDKLTGVYCASITPINTDYSINKELFLKHCNNLLTQGLSGLAVFGTTGEANAFNVEEKIYDYNKDQLFASMMAYHVEGFSERKFNSRHNLNEVKAIILWLNMHKGDIEKAYNVDSIESVLGIITPFASQKTALSKALIESGFKVNDIKLGTVHALQGAERNIVLFSSVYSNEDEGVLFFDRDNKPNMLNVAVSRARDSFILFGDTRIFDETKNIPSGILKRHLNMFEMPT